MFSKLFRSIAATLAVLATLGCAAQPPKPSSGIFFQTTPGQVYRFQGYAGSNQPDGIVVGVPQYCAGGMLSLQAEYRTPNGVRGGRESYHDIHADYELKTSDQPQPSYPSNWPELPSVGWSEINKAWAMPTNMRWAKARLMLQGVAGPLEVRNVRIGC